MVQPPPARPGDAVEDIDTPALIIDLDAFEHNLSLMASRLPDGVRLRPHAKTHKSAEISLRQMALGAVGVCCQKTSEAQALVDGGVDNVMVSNQVVGAKKLARLAGLTERATISVCVDDASNIDAIADAMANESPNNQINVFVEIDVGNSRCGVAPGEPAAALARKVVAAPRLNFAGLQAYHGSAQHMRTANERRHAIEAAVAAVEKTTGILSADGINCDTIAGAGTGSFENEISSGVYNELQAGSYAFMDADYARNLDESGEPVSTFKHALFVMATVISSTRPGHAVLDAGHKSVAVDSGLPTVWQAESISYTGASDEHGVLAADNDAPTPGVGATVMLVPGHCDPTVNLHDWYVGVRNDVVEVVWPVTARGAVF